MVKSTQKTVLYWKTNSHFRTYFAEMERLYLLESELHTELLKLKTENGQLKTECRREPLQLRLDRSLERSSHDERGSTAASSINEGDNLRGKKPP